MENLKALEEKVVTAVGALTKARADNAALAEKLKKVESEARRLQHELEKVQGAMAGVKKMEDEVTALRAEREAVKSRIAVMLDKLSALDGED